MLIAKIIQENVTIEIEELMSNFQYSQNLEMQFVRDENYADGILTGWYKKHKEEEKLLDIAEDGVFTLPADIFTKDGSVQFSFAINYTNKVIHLGWVELYVERAFGNTVDILPEEAETWITVVTCVAKKAIIDDVELVKEKATESSNNAKNAIESANLAKTSADNASLSERKALEHMSNAETFKNNASGYAEQADLAKNSALESATNASNSASNALDNANKAKEHLDSAIEKINTFNADYTNKVNSFNSNVENANNTLSVKLEETNTDLDTKITEANSSIDAKVTTATEHANKAKTEADRAVLATDGKLDKNQGVENAGKAMVVGEDGNVVPGSALPDNVYTQEEVDYLLRDKMDKPYTPVTLTENTTIDCTLAGNFKIDSIEGNTVQDVEENIVPTPARPIPIISKKTLANGDYVELRSLKESENLFDLGIQNQIDLIPNTDAYRQIDIPVVLKTKTTYAFKFDDFEIPAKMWVVLKIVNNDNVGVLVITNTKNDSNEQITIQSKTSFFNTNENSEFYFSYYVAIQDEETKRWLQSEETFKNYWYTKLIKNIMLVEGTDAPSNYIPSTVRDYKIVDHTNKKAWIERNVQEVNINSLVYSYAGDNGEGVGVRFYASVKPTLKFANEIYSNIFISYSAYDYTKESIYGGNSAGGKTLSIIVKESNISEHTQEALLNYINNPNAVAYYALETPVIEEISYLESDTSEFGESFQDSTSPSPTIPSDLKAVTELNVKCIGKNLLDENYFFNNNSWSNYELNIELLPNTKYTFSRVNNLGYQSGIFLKILNTIEGASSQIINSNSQTMNKSNVTFTTLDSGVITFSIQGIKPKELKDVLGYAQLEAGDTATEYEPYQGNSIRYALEKPLLKIGDIADTINITKENRENKLNSIVLDGSEDETWNINNLGYETTIRFQYTVVTSNYPSGTNHKVNCNKFNNILGDISNREYVRLTSAGNGYSYLWVYIKKIRLEEVSVTGFRKWLRENPLKVIYDTSYVVTEPLEVELMEKLRQLKTYSPATNIFIEGEVKPIYNCQYPKDLLLAQQKLESTVLTLQEEVVKNV